MKRYAFIAHQTIHFWGYVEAEGETEEEAKVRAAEELTFDWSQSEVNEEWQERVEK